MRKSLVASAIILGVSVAGCSQSAYTRPGGSTAPTTSTTTTPWTGPSVTGVPVTTPATTEVPGVATVTEVVTQPNAPVAKAPAAKAPKTTTSKTTTPKAPRTTTPKPPRTTTPPKTPKTPKPPASVTINNGDPYPNIQPPTKLHIRNMKAGACGLIGGSYHYSSGTCYNVNY